MVDTVVGGIKTGERPQYGTGDTAAVRLLKQKTSQWESQRVAKRHYKCQRQRKLAHSNNTQKRERHQRERESQRPDQTEGREKRDRKTPQ